jgi:S-adenosyl-L-methionine hydrolase (adenosine-forming)
MIILATDFGLEGPYTGQMKAVLHRDAPGVPVVDLFSDLPPWNVKAAAYLLAAYAAEFPEGTIFLAIVDPGVGGDRSPAAVEVDGRWFVGPDNGIFEIVKRRAESVHWWGITWAPENLSASFHGRDLFAPVAARLATGGSVPGEPAVTHGQGFSNWPDDLPEIVYIDRYGNGITGVRASVLAPNATLEICGQTIGPARTFSDLPIGAPFWYPNSNGLVEIAVNQDRASRVVGFDVGIGVALPTG